jgi:hypothetical protein
MQYVCLVYGDESRLTALSGDERDALIEEALAYDEELRAAGHLVLARALEQTDDAVTVRVRADGLSATDGPFAETVEQLGGFVLIEANDLNEAIRVAGRIPAARYGSVEVRPIVDLWREHT